MGVSNESKIAKGGESAIDRGPVNSRSRSFRAGYDLVGGQMLIGAIKYLDDRLACPGHPFVTFAQQGQCRLHARRRRHVSTHPFKPTPHDYLCRPDAIMSHLVAR